MITADHTSCILHRIQHTSDDNIQLIIRVEPKSIFVYSQQLTESAEISGLYCSHNRQPWYVWNTSQQLMSTLQLITRVEYTGYNTHHCSFYANSTADHTRIQHMSYTSNWTQADVRISQQLMATSVRDTSWIFGSVYTSAFPAQPGRHSGWPQKLCGGSTLSTGFSEAISRAGPLTSKDFLPTSVILHKYIDPSLSWYQNRSTHIFGPKLPC